MRYLYTRKRRILLTLHCDKRTRGELAFTHSLGRLSACATLMSIADRRRFQGFLSQPTARVDLDSPSAGKVKNETLLCSLTRQSARGGHCSADACRTCARPWRRDRQCRPHRSLLQRRNPAGKHSYRKSSTSPKT